MRHAAAGLRRATAVDRPGRIDPSAPEAVLDQELDPAAFHDLLASVGLNYGPAFRGLARIRRRDGEALGRIVPQDGPEPGAEAYVAHPAILDY